MYLPYFHMINYPPYRHLIIYPVDISIAHFSSSSPTGNWVSGSKRLKVSSSASTNGNTNVHSYMSQRGGDRGDDRGGSRGGGGDVGLAINYYEMNDDNGNEADVENSMKVYAAAVAMARIGW